MILHFKGFRPKLGDSSLSKSCTSQSWWQWVKCTEFMELTPGRPRMVTSLPTATKIPLFASIYQSVIYYPRKPRVQQYTLVVTVVISATGPLELEYGKAKCRVKGVWKVEMLMNTEMLQGCNVDSDSVPGLGSRQSQGGPDTKYRNGYFKIQTG